MKPHRIIALLMGGLIGVFYWWVAAHFWGMHVIDGPLALWVQNTPPPRHIGFGIRALLYSGDVLISVLLAVPFACMFVMSGRLNKWQCLVAAVVAANVAACWGMEWESIPLLARSWGSWFGLAVSLLALPAAFFIVRSTPRKWLHE